MFISIRQPVLLLPLFLFSILGPAALAQWSHSPIENNPICVASSLQLYPVITGDGQGGAIVAWSDNRTVSDLDVYAQRIDAQGVVRWTTNGVVVSAASGFQDGPRIASDGAGGAIIAWLDQRSVSSIDVYAQRIDSSGAALWAADGVPVATVQANRGGLAIEADGAGGAFIAWHDGRSGLDYDLYVQRVNSAGSALWTNNGVAISAAAGSQTVPDLDSDGSGGAILCWNDTRNGNQDVYAQRVNGSGLVQWTVNGVAVCTVAGEQTNHVAVDDGAGGVYIAWNDPRNGANVDLYAQRVDASGTALWTAGGIAVGSGAGDQWNSSVARDGDGGVYLAWSDSRYGAYADVYAQRMDPAGYALWASNGIPVCVASDQQVQVKAHADGEGGVFIIWTDFRTNVDYDLYSQRLDRFGGAAWGSNGIAVSRAPRSQTHPVQVSDGADGLIVSWQDQRSGNYDVYAQKVDRNGYHGNNEPWLGGVADVPGDQGGNVTVSWDRSDLDQAPYEVVTEYSVWRGIEGSRIPATAIVKLDGGPLSGAAHGTFRRIGSGENATSWELVGTVAAHRFAKYSYTSATTSDSAAGWTPWVKFLVSAHTSDPYVYWDSEVDSGYSVDNLSPAGVAPVAASVSPGPSVTVHWKGNTTDPDVKLYEVHRSLVSGFTPAAGTKIGQTVDTLLLDGAPVAGSVNYYKVVTVDLHDNRSVPSAEAPAAVGTTQLYAVQDRWNLVSVPMLLGDYAKTAVYPTAVSNAFAFTNQYTASATLANGPGYWVKFDGAQSVALTGVPLESGSYAVQPGWNMVGSIGSAVEVGTITSTPPGLVTSNFFRFDAQYAASTAIEPGRGYWVKATGAGTLHLAAPGAALADPAVNNPSARIRIVDDGEMPPPPPGEELTAELPGEYRLEQNYPNPFNPSTQIRYAVPEAVEVRITVYNQLGQEVAELVEGTVPAGYHEAVFDASDLPSGMYTYRIAAGTFTASRRMLLVR